MSGQACAQLKFLHEVHMFKMFDFAKNQLCTVVFWRCVEIDKNLQKSSAVCMVSFEALKNTCKPIYNVENSDYN